MPHRSTSRIAAATHAVPSATLTSPSSASQASSLVDLLQTLQEVRSRDAMLSWAETRLRQLIPYSLFACLLAEPRSRSFQVRDVIASDNLSERLQPLEVLRSPHDQRVSRRPRTTDEASHALIQEWMRDRSGLMIGTSGPQHPSAATHVIPLLSCFRGHTTVARGVKEAFGGSATLCLLGISDRNEVRPGVSDTLDLVMPMLHVARQRIYRHERSQAVSEDVMELTPREARILTIIADGCTDKEAARITGRSVHTVRNQVRSLLTKLGARNRTQAVLIAARHNLLDVVPS